MVELFEKDLKDDGRKSSKGNQLKWETGGVWYKADYTGYEGLSEYIVSGLLASSSLTAGEFVEYSLETIKYRAQFFNFFKSLDYSGGWQVITLERLFKNNYGTSLNSGIYAIEDHIERLRYLVNQVERATGLKNFGKYMSKMLTIDAVFLNEDRHTHNISILWNGYDKYRLCPFYDHGAALLSDTTLDYPLGFDIFANLDEVRAKTICTSFDEQVEIAESLYGRNITFSWGNKEIDRLLSGTGIYSTEIISRVRDLLSERRRKYSYLFVR